MHKIAIQPACARQCSAILHSPTKMQAAESEDINVPRVVAKLLGLALTPSRVIINYHLPYR
jgi:hypothetical protein